MATNHDVEVIEKVEKDLYCVICQNVIKDDMQLDCDHEMCKSCLDDLEKTSEESGLGFICLRCRCEIFKTQVHPSIMIDRMTSSVIAKCKNTAKGCEWTGELCKMMDHLGKECNFHLVTCSFTHCEKIVERCALAEHQEECPYKTIVCSNCRWVCFQSQIQDHYSTCDKYPVKCPYNCSNEFMEREEVEEHCNICGKESIQCEFASYGCDFTCPRKDMLVHNQDASRHLSLTVKRHHVDMQEIKKEIGKLRIRENSETDFYQKKVFELVIREEKSNSVNIKKLFEPSIIVYEQKYGYFVKGVPWLKSKLKEVCEGKDQTCKAQYKEVLNEYIEMLKRSITDLKKEVHLPNNVWEKIKNNIEKELPKQLAIKGKKFINTSLSLKNRLHRFVERLKPNTMYQIEGSRFYKLYNARYTLERLFSLTSAQGCSVFEDDFLNFSVTYYNFCLTLKTNKKFSCVIYTAENPNSLLEEHKIEIDGTQLSFEAAKYYFSSSDKKYYIIVRFM